MKNFKLIQVIIFFLGAFAFSNEQCVEFLHDLPSFSEQELEVIKEYYPLIVQKHPKIVVSAYIDTIFKQEDGYAFYFLSYKNLRSYKCIKDSGKGIIVDMLDGDTTIVIPIKE